MSIENINNTNFNSIQFNEIAQQNSVNSNKENTSEKNHETSQNDVIRNPEKISQLNRMQMNNNINAKNIVAEAKIKSVMQGNEEIMDKLKSLSEKGLSDKTVISLVSQISSILQESSEKIKEAFTRMKQTERQEFVESANKLYSEMSSKATISMGLAITNAVIGVLGSGAGIASAKIGSDLAGILSSSFSNLASTAISTSEKTASDFADIEIAKDKDIKEFRLSSSNECDKSIQEQQQEIIKILDMLKSILIECGR